MLFAEIKALGKRSGCGELFRDDDWNETYEEILKYVARLFVSNIQRRQLSGKIPALLNQPARMANRTAVPKINTAKHVRQSAVNRRPSKVIVQPTFAPHNSLCRTSNRGVIPVDAQSGPTDPRASAEERHRRARLTFGFSQRSHQDQCRHAHIFDSPECLRPSPCAVRL